MKTFAMKFGPPIFIISPVKRSGTNYLNNILCQYQDCFSPGPLWEDELLREAYLLSEYADFTVRKCNPEWNVEVELMPRQQMLALPGAGFTEMLHAQFSNSAEMQTPCYRDFSRPGARPCRYVTAPPKAEKLALLPALFPEAYLRILVGRGRASARSGQTSFAKPFDCTVREWAGTTDKIGKFTRIPLCNSDWHRLVRYKELAAAPTRCMRDRMAFLDLGANRISLDKLDSMPVIGSSSLRVEGTELPWTRDDKPKEFAPLARAQELGPFKRSHSSYLAGDSGRSADYKFPESTATLRPLHALRAGIWRPVWKLCRLPWPPRRTARSLQRQMRGSSAVPARRPLPPRRPC